MGDGSECGVVKIVDFGLVWFVDSGILFKSLYENGLVVILWYCVFELLFGV